MAWAARTAICSLTLWAQHRPLWQKMLPKAFLSGSGLDLSCPPAPASLRPKSEVLELCRRIWPTPVFWHGASCPGMDSWYASTPTARTSVWHRGAWWRAEPAPGKGHSLQWAHQVAEYPWHAPDGTLSCHQSPKGHSHSLALPGLPIFQAVS